MASAVITCPECAKKFKGQENLAGKRIRCPFCKKPFLVPVADDDEAESPVPKKEPVAAAAASKPPAQAASDDEDEFEEGKDPYGVAALDLAPRCPHCTKKMVSAEAVVCVYCGYNTLTRTHGATVKLIATTAGEHFMHLLPGLLNFGFILFLIALFGFYSLVFPSMVGGGDLSFLDAESMRLLPLMFIFLPGLWPLGYFAYKRLVLEPKPKEKIKE